MGCLYWIFIGWWRELFRWLFILIFKVVYWVYFGWWIKLLQNKEARKTIFQIILCLLCVVLFGLIVSEFWIFILIFFGLCIVIHFVRLHHEYFKDKKQLKKWLYILSYTVIIVCTPFAVYSIIDYVSTRDNIDIFIFVLFFIPIGTCVNYIMKTKRNNTEEGNQDQNKSTCEYYDQESIEEPAHTKISEINNENTTNENGNSFSIDFIINQLDRTRELEKIINTTNDEKELYISLNELTRIFYDLTMYEDVFDFSIPPSNELKRISENREKYIDSLYERINRQKSPERMDTMTGYEFEEFCSELLVRNGFEKVELTKKSGDHGIDILAEKEGITYAVQCKCYSSNIGNSAVQQAHAGKSFYKKDIAAVMTNRYFTAQAIEEAETLNVKLWDRDYIIILIKKSEQDNSNL